MSVDILMSAYDAEKTIGEAIESIITQTYQDWKLYIFDDCSTDETFNIALTYSFADSRIRLIHSDTNIGTYAAKNFLFKNYSESKYVALHDADDRSKPERLFKQSYMFDISGKDIVCIGTGIEEFWSNEDARYVHTLGKVCEGNKRSNIYPKAVWRKDLKEVKGFLEDLYYAEFLMFKFCMNGSIMLRSYAIKQIGGWDGDTRVGGDTDFFMRMIGAYKSIINTKTILYERRFHKDSLTSRCDCGVVSDIRRKYSYSRVDTIKKCIEGEVVKYNFEYPEFGYEVF